MIIYIILNNISTQNNVISRQKNLTTHNSAKRYQLLQYLILFTQ
jgi:hypothetical protein